VNATVSEPKREAAEAALRFVPERGLVGLGTGSTARHFIDGVGRLVASGRQLSCVATSEVSRRQAEALGIPLLADDGPWALDLCVDGADEVSESLDLIKGGGGCHSREKIVNQAARLNVIVVDESKLSARLGEKWPVPVEVLAFGAQSIRTELERFGAVKARWVNGQPYVTDSGNLIFDVNVGPISDPAALDRQLLSIAGVVETGLFIGRADHVLVAGPSGVVELAR
jgi:ribose 5-phosphate isomerase A